MDCGLGVVRWNKLLPSEVALDPDVYHSNRKQTNAALVASFCHKWDGPNISPLSLCGLLL